MRYVVGLLVLVAAAALPMHDAQAVPIQFSATLSGTNENPPNSSTATGFTTVTIDSTAHTMRVQVTFSGLENPSSAAHIHCCIAPPGNVMVATQVPTFIDFPPSVSGTYDHTFDTLADSTYNPAFIAAHGGTAAAAETTLFDGLFAGQAYLNIHDLPNFGGGEIRGFLTIAAVPEPTTLTLLGAGLLALAVVLRRRRR